MSDVVSNFITRLHEYLITDASNVKHVGGTGAPGDPAIFGLDIIELFVGGPTTTPISLSVNVTP